MSEHLPWATAQCSMCPALMRVHAAPCEGESGPAYQVHRRLPAHERDIGERTRGGSIKWRACPGSGEAPGRGWGYLDAYLRASMADGGTCSYQRLGPKIRGGGEPARHDGAFVRADRYLPDPGERRAALASAMEVIERTHWQSDRVKGSSSKDLREARRVVAEYYP